MPEPSTRKGCNLRKEAQGLIEDAVVQQAESSASRMRSMASAKAGGTARQDREVSVHTHREKGQGRPRYTPRSGQRCPRCTIVSSCLQAQVKERIWDTRGNANDGEARNILNQKKRDGEARGYHPRRGGRYDSKEDRSPSPKPPGTRVFS